MSDTILFEIKDQVGIITLNRPKAFNSCNREMALAWQAALDECKSNSEVRAVYLTGNGKAFCAGQDISELQTDITISTIISEHYNPIVQRIRDLEKPVVCAVNGVAAGAGANIALACDITVATESAKFTQAFSKIGLIPDSGGTHTLPRLVGYQKAAALMMLSEVISANEAERIGMIYKVMKDEEFAESSYAIAKKLASMPTVGLGLTKRALNAGMQNDLTTQLALEDTLQAQAADTYDYKEGITAFMEKRKAVFKGK